MLPQQPMTKVTCLTLTSLWKKMSLHKFFNKVDCPWVSLIWNNHYRNGSLSNKRPRGSFWWRAVLKQLDKFKGIAIVNIQKWLNNTFMA
jgi:hypothetical protein